MGSRSKKQKRTEGGKKPTKKTKSVIIVVIAAAVIAGIGIIAVFNSGNEILSSSPSSSPSGQTTIDTTFGSPILGDPDAPVTIVEFGDYQCPFCRMWNQNTKPPIEKNYIETGKAKLVYVDFAIIGPDSLDAHAGSYCAAEQGLYWEYHNYLYQNQGHENDGWAKADNLKNMVAGIQGMNIDEFSSCIDSGKYEERVNYNRDVAREAGATSTPTFVIIGKNDAVGIRGAQPYGSFSQAIDEMLATVQ